MTSNVVLVNLPIQSYLQKDYIYEYNPSLGLLSMATYLELHGYTPIVMDLCYERITMPQFLSRLKEHNPLVVGISVYTENFDMTIETATRIKQVLPEVKLVLGGPHPSLNPQECMESNVIDFVIRKEGESPLLELMEALTTAEESISFDQINGLSFRRDGMIIRNPIRQAITDLDLLPIAKREFMGLENYRETVNISTSRGCPGRCIYCSATALSGATYRTRNVQNVYSEMEMLYLQSQGNLANYYIVDDTFTAIPERVEAFTDLLRSSSLGVTWQCESRIDVMTEDLLKRMSETGCATVQYGIESGSQTVLNLIRKEIDLERAREVIDLTYRYKILPCLSFMVGHYCDTKETMRETLAFIEDMYSRYQAEIALSFNTPFPGTWQYNQRDKIGLRLITHKYKMFSLLDPIVETDHFTISDQRSIFFEATPYLARTTKLEILKKGVEPL